LILRSDVRLGVRLGERSGRAAWRAHGRHATGPAGRSSTN